MVMTSDDLLLDTAYERRHHGTAAASDDDDDDDESSAVTSYSRAPLRQVRQLVGYYTAFTHLSIRST